MEPFTPVPNWEAYITLTLSFREAGGPARDLLGGAESLGQLGANLGTLMGKVWANKEEWHPIVRGTPGGFGPRAIPKLEIPSQWYTERF